MNKQLNFLIDEEKEKALFDYIENSLGYKLYPCIIRENSTSPDDVFFITAPEFEEKIRYVNSNDGTNGKMIYPFDEWANMIPVIEYRHMGEAYDDNILCRIYLNYSNIPAESKPKIKDIFNKISRFIKNHSKRSFVEGMFVYRLEAL